MLSIGPDKLKALAKARGTSAPKPRVLTMGKVESAPKAKPSEDIKNLSRHAPTIESAIADHAQGKFSIKDKPTAQDVALAQAVYDALPTRAKEVLAPLADVSLARAIVLADELADAGIIDDPEPMTAFLFLAGQILRQEAGPEEGEEA